jgi:hypothetical protein
VEGLTHEGGFAGLVPSALPVPAAHGEQRAGRRGANRASP